MSPGSRADLLAMLHRMEEVLDSAGETRWVPTVRSLHRWVQAGDDLDDRDVAREVLTLFQGGMGGFNDLALLDGMRVLPEQAEFAELRSRLFEAARALL